MSGKIFIVEDEFIIAQGLNKIIRGLGYPVMGSADSAKKALSQIEQERPDLLLLDIKIKGDIDGIELAKKINEQFKIPFLFVTSYSDTDTVKEMSSTNPFGYILKPFNERDIRVALELAFTKIGSSYQEYSPPRKKDSTIEIKDNSSGFNSIVGNSVAMKEVFENLQKVAKTDVTVLLIGETGTGKELIMNAIHENSGRSGKPLVKVNCSAIPSELIESELFGHEKGSFTGATSKRVGKFEAAHEGSIFLDEIGELPLASQAKLLRCLQEKEIEMVGGTNTKKVDVRVIAATNRDLPHEVANGRFRADLFFRINIFPIQIPPLRVRDNDVISLAQYFLASSSKKLNKTVELFTPEILDQIKQYHWPGNIRELEHYIERGVILADGNEFTLPVQNLNLETRGEIDQFELKSLSEYEKEKIIQTLEYCNWKIRGSGGAAEILKIHPNTLDSRIKKLGITKSE